MCKPLSVSRLALVAVAVVAFAAPAGGDGPTMSADFARDVRAWHQREFVDAFDAVRAEAGDKAAWHDDARAFLADDADRRTATRAAEWHTDFESPDRWVLTARGRSLIDAGCDDPLVRYAVATLLERAGRRGQAGNLYAAAMNDMNALRRKGGAAYGPIWLADAARGVLEHAPPPREAARKRAPDVEGVALAAVVAQPWLAKDEAAAEVTVNFLINHLLPASHLRTLEKLDAAADVIARLRDVPGANPWVLDMLEGEFAITAGWFFRGTGYSRDVTPEGWAALTTYMTRANDLLNRAHDLHPDRPHAASRLIFVAMAGYAGDTTPRDWFDKAVAARPDHSASYSSLAQSMRPRWGGSMSGLARMAATLARDPRYETAIPYQGFTFIWSAATKMRPAGTS